MLRSPGRPRPSISWLLLAALLLAPPPPGVCAGGHKPGAARETVRIEVKAGEVFELDAPFKKTGRRLRKGGHNVAVGQWLRGAPGKGGPKYTIFLPDGARLVTHTRPVALPPMAPRVAAAYRRMLQHILRPAGRLKGEPVPLRLWHPSPVGKTWAPGFALRWAPRDVSPVILQITAGPSGDVLWIRSDVTAQRGALVDPAASEAVARALSTGAKPVEFVLEAGGVRRSFALRLADPSTDPALAEELRWWDTHSGGAVQLLGKGAEFQKRGFLSAAAEAFFQAWRLDPESTLLHTTFRNSLGLLGLSDEEILAVLTEADPDRRPLLSRLDPTAKISLKVPAGQAP